MTDLPKGYVVYEGKRYKVVGAWRNDMGIGDVLMYRLDPGMGSWPNIAAPAVECQPWQRGTMRHIKGKAIHREKRPVHLDIDTGAEIIKAGPVRSAGPPAGHQRQARPGLCQAHGEEDPKGLMGYVALPISQSAALLEIKPNEDEYRSGNTKADGQGNREPREGGRSHAVHSGGAQSGARSGHAGQHQVNTVEKAGSDRPLTPDGNESTKSVLLSEGL
jgi:hypothetical protein